MEIFDAETEGFGKTKTAPIEEMDGEAVCTRLHGPEQPTNFVMGENGGKAFGPIGLLDGADVPKRIVQNLFADKNQRIERLGGEIEADAEPGQGTRISSTLPIREATTTEESRETV